MYLVLLGPPGAGKGTYAFRLSGYFHVPHISTGDLVRNEIKTDTKLGKQIKKYSNKGLLVPDIIITEILKKRIFKPDCSKGAILDGFPRTVKQAELLENIILINAVINIDVSDEVIVDRISNRLICRNCSAIYNRKYLKPKQDMICDECGGPLYRRNDDDPKVIKERLKVYREETAPLIEYYAEKRLLKNFRSKDPQAPPDIIIKEIINLIHDTEKKIIEN